MITAAESWIQSLPFIFWAGNSCHS